MQPSMRNNQEINPYESPRVASHGANTSSKLDLIFFLINFLCCLVFIFLGTAAMVDSYVGSGSPFGLLAGPFFIVPATLFAIGEWLHFISKRERLRRPLGVVCGAISAFWAFAFVTNVFEAIAHRPAPDEPPNPADFTNFLLIFSSICLPVIACNAYCCRYRLRVRRPS